MNLAEILDECPFCKKHYLQLATVYDVYRIICLKCRTFGPPGALPAEAIDKWNYREKK